MIFKRFIIKTNKLTRKLISIIKLNIPFMFFQLLMRNICSLLFKTAVIL